MAVSFEMLVLILFSLSCMTMAIRTSPNEVNQVMETEINYGRPYLHLILRFLLNYVKVRLNKAIFMCLVIFARNFCAKNWFYVDPLLNKKHALIMPVCAICTIRTYLHVLFDTKKNIVFDTVKHFLS